MTFLIIILTIVYNYGLSERYPFLTSSFAFVLRFLCIVINVLFLLPMNVQVRKLLLMNLFLAKKAKFEFLYFCIFCC